MTSTGSPQKTHEFHNHHFDSTIWNDFRFRDDDIVIGTYAKAGTTWVQQIVAQLLFDGERDLETAEMSPWMDLRIPPKEVKLAKVEAQTHRRFLKTHLPVDALVFSQKVKYIYIARDGRDIVWSMYNHQSNANDAWYDALNNTPGRVGPPIERPPESILQYFDDWLEKDGYPWWPYWENIRTWWDIRELSNVKLMHFADLKADMPGMIREIADYLEIPVNEEKWDDILHHCSFPFMKEHGSKSVPAGGIFWEGGSKTFINKGVNGLWHEMLSEEQVSKYEDRAVRELGEECANWLKNGGT